MRPTTPRDARLDTYRAMIMIYTVCVIHTTYWFAVGTEPLLSAMLFEMPVIFFIAGASQAVTEKKRNIIQTIINRSKRILLSLYIFLFFTFATAISLTATGTDIHPYTIDLSRFTAAGLAKVLLTGGSTVFPFYGYTWFVSVYLVISCSLPIQQKLLRHILYYKRCEQRLFTVVTTVATIMTIICFITGNMVPMQSHKFPADIFFVIFGTASLCLLTIIFRRIDIRYTYILRLWNERGYTIYLYQTVSHAIVYAITYSWIDSIDSHIVKFLIYAPMAFTVTTLLSYITYPTEKYIISKITAK